MADFDGKTVVCVASGPSLTQQQCDLVRSSGLDTIAVNNAWKLAPFAKTLYAADYAWWLKHANDVPDHFKKWTNFEPAADKFGLNLHRVRLADFNSGLLALMLAEAEGAKRAILIGYDCRITLQTHFHGDHKGLSNPTAERCLAFIKQFNRYASVAKLEVVNCTPKSALNCFRKNTLEDELC